MDAGQAYDVIEEMLNAANVPGQPTVHVFLGEPDPVMDSDNKAHAYVAIWPGPGSLDVADTDLEGNRGSRLLTFQITAAGGDIPRAMRAVLRVQRALIGWRLDSTTGVVFENGDAGPLQKDTTVSPTRWFAPLLLAVAL